MDVFKINDDDDDDDDELTIPSFNDFIMTFSVSLYLKL